MVRFRKVLRRSVRTFIKGERASEAVEMVILFPIILLLVGFIVDQFITYNGVNSITTVTNEAIRYAMVEESEEDALNAVKETLTDRMKTSKLAWCTSNNTRNCVDWGDAISETDSRNDFESDNSKNLLFSVENGWCDGGYITLGVRAHKSSVFPSYESFRRLITHGGTLYHTHSYIITARVESTKKCES